MNKSIFYRICSPKVFPFAIVLAFIFGFVIRGISSPSNPPRISQETTSKTESHVEEWTCSMHPQIRRQEPGQCPICGMDLIPVTQDQPSKDLQANQIQLSPRAEKLAEIQVTPVVRGAVNKEIRMIGIVEYDETKVKNISAWLPGRIDKLFVNFTGTLVKKGEPLASLYSPEIFSSQEELIQAIRTSKELEDSGLSSIRDTALKTVEASRNKLLLLGLSESQVKAVENQNAPDSHVTINSPLGGVVIMKNAVEGMYVDTGMMLYSVADLSNVWVKLDVYESDIQWVKNGQDVVLTSESFPGQLFKGKITFIDPVLDNTTRTVKVRVNVPNPGYKLKPDMFVHSVVSTGTGTKGNPLIIPASAPLITGKRAVVYIASPEQNGVYEGREIVLGSLAGDSYIVESGLTEGERVVVNGAFKIDSAVQIRAKPSMMNPEGGVSSTGHVHGAAEKPVPSDEKDVTAQAGHEGHKMDEMGTKEKSTAVQKQSEGIPQKFLAQLDGVYAAYFTVQEALSKDNLAPAKTGAKNLITSLKDVDMTLLSNESHMAWMNELGKIKTASEKISGAASLEIAREGFIELSTSLINVAKTFGVSGKITMFRFHCPMANDSKGADWLQNKKDLANPFFGLSMSKCGDLVETFQQKK